MPPTAISGRPISPSANSTLQHEALTRALLLAPDSDVVCNLMGTVQRARNDVDGARRSFAKALALNPGNAEAANNLGNLAKEARDFPTAEGYYRQAVQINPRFADA